MDQNLPEFCCSVAEAEFLPGELGAQTLVFKGIISRLNSRVTSPLLKLDPESSFFNHKTKIAYLSREEYKKESQ